MIKLYHDFKEIEAEIREATKDIPVVYKYRDWRDHYHQRIITNREAWFAHPHTLNDPYDVRPPYNFVIGDIDWNIFRVKLYEAGKSVEAGLTEEELNAEVERRLKEAQRDPVAYFQKNRSQYIADKAHYDQIGVFSCCTSVENEPMWANYGNNHAGFSIGFDVVTLAESLSCSVGAVEYSDDPIDYYILGDNSKGFDREIFKKGNRWRVEEEFRFITSGVGIYRQRASVFPAETVKEIVFGINTTAETQQQVMEEAKKTLPDVPFYRMETKQAAYGLQKTRL